jgi:hypothetical protein
MEKKWRSLFLTLSSRKKLLAAIGMLAFGVALTALPLLFREFRLRGYAQRLRAANGRIDPALVDRLVALVHESKWSEAVALFELFGPEGKENPEILLYSARAYYETERVDQARECVRLAKSIFRRSPEIRIQIETRDPPLFQRIGFLVREPGA